MISVVIPTYRKPALLRRTLEALLPQGGGLRPASDDLLKRVVLKLNQTECSLL